MDPVDPTGPLADPEAPAAHPGAPLTDPPRRPAAAGLDYRSLFEHSNDAILLVDRATLTVVDANERAETMFGYTRPELVGLAVARLDAPTAGRHEQALSEAVGSDVGAIATRVTTSRGDLLDVAATAWTVDLADAAVFFVLLRDVTPQKAAERELILNARRMKQLFDTSPTITHVLAVGENGFQATWISENVKRILGYSADEVLADRTWWYRGIHPEDQIIALRGNQDVVAFGADSVEYRFRHADGTYRWMQEELRLVTDDDGTPLEVVGSWSDITAHKEAEAALREGERRLRESQRMEAVVTLAGGIAHDFNNLLMTIAGFAEILRDEARGPHEEIDEITRATERGAELVRQLLAFSRRQSLNPEPTDLNTVIQRMERVIERILGDEVDLRTSLQPQLWHVEADPAQVEQMLLNLVVNSRDAMPEGGDLIVETANVTLGSEYDRLGPDFRPGDYVSMAVTDSGTGMPPEVRKRVFEPFFTTKPQGKGTGLGLSTVYGTAKQSGGHVYVDSAERAGTRVEVFLPRMREDAPGLRRPVPPERARPIRAPRTASG